MKATSRASISTPSTRWRRPRRGGVRCWSASKRPPDGLKCRMDFSPVNTTSEYLDLPLRAFLDLVASGGPAPGGGSVAAIAVALAAGLSGMAARLSADQHADASVLADRGDAARRTVAPLARADAEAYGRVLDAYREPDSETRTERIKDALSAAAD